VAEKKRTRREVLKVAAYATPVILTLSAKPAKARSASGCNVSDTPKPTR
jgi:hypothetical protein